MNEIDKHSEKELIDAIKELLRSSGHLNILQAEMRAKVTEALRTRQDCLKADGANSGPPPMSDEVLLVNDLVREYLEWNGYLYTASVMTSETGMTQEKRSRVDLCANVGVKDDEKSAALPLLSNIVAAYTERIKRKISKSTKRDASCC